jgi:hypothetical protein
MTRAILLTIILALGCARPPRPAGPVRDDWRRVALGLCEDYPEETRSLDEVRRDLDLLAGAGVNVLRVSLGWDDVEPQRDHYDLDFWDGVVRLAGERRIRLIPYVAYTPSWNGQPGPDTWRSPPRDLTQLTELMELLARRYRGQIDSWEIWNEPDNADFWRGDVASYGALLRAGAAGVRRGNPEARVVSGGLAGTVGFLRALLGQAETARVIDVVNVHAYFETWNGEPLERLTSYLAEVATLAGARPVWLAEVGYSDHRRGGVVSAQYGARYGYEHTLSFQADVLVRTLALALATPRLGLVAWYEVKDPAPLAAVIGDDNNRHLGVSFADHRPKPALASLGFVQRLFGRGFRVLDGELGRASGAAEVHAFLLADGRALVAAWLPTNPEGAPVPDPAGAATDRRREALAVTLPCPGATTALLHDIAGRPAGAVPLSRGPRQVTLGPVELQGGATRLILVGGCAAAVP